MMMSVQEQVGERIAARLDCQHLEVQNESHKHRVPEGSESHFKVVVVSDEFENEKLLDRHRLINEALADLLAGQIHALALHTYTTREWRDKNGDAPMTPPCRGGSTT